MYPYMIGFAELLFLKLVLGEVAEEVWMVM
jgi:hypothetical protein